MTNNTNPSSSSSAVKTTKPQQQCHLFEILQYTCAFPTRQNGYPTTQCFPIPRLFRQCGKDAAVEITRVVDYNGRTGEIELPKNLGKNLPQGKPWNQVKRYMDKVDEACEKP